MSRERPDAVYVTTSSFLKAGASNWPNWRRSTGYPQSMGCVNTSKPVD